MFSLISRQKENAQWEGLMCATSRAPTLLWAGASSPGGDPMPMGQQPCFHHRGEHQALGQSHTHDHHALGLNQHLGCWVPASAELLHTAQQVKRLHRWWIWPDPKEYTSFLVKWEWPTHRFLSRTAAPSAARFWISFSWAWASASRNNMPSCPFLNLCKSCEHTDISHFVQNVRTTFFFSSSNFTETWQNEAMLLFYPMGALPPQWISQLIIGGKGLFTSSYNVATRKDLVNHIVNFNFLWMQKRILR